MDGFSSFAVSVEASEKIFLRFMVEEFTRKTEFTWSSQLI
jgi:hypothetical protein